MSGARAGLWVATHKGLFGLRRGKGGWRIATTAFLGDNCTAVLPDPRDGSVTVAIGHGHFGCKLHRSEDGGATFAELPAPAYPPPPDDEPAWVDMFGRTIPQALELIWSLHAGPPSRPGELWCGTMPGGLFHSPDGGASWSLVRSLWDAPERRRWFGGGADYPGLHSIWLHPGDDARLGVAVSCGGVWLSDDRGATFTCHGEGVRAAYLPPGQAPDPAVQDPHRVVACPAAPERLWMQHHNGIFRSDDGGRTWREIERAGPSTFGFAVAVHPRDPDTAWFVPAIKDERRIPVDGRLVVTRTRDGGETFDVLDGGLPGSHAYHLVFRHGLDVHADGETLAMGSTTGSLWTSADAGDNWARVSAELPPVHALRFAADGA